MADRPRGYFDVRAGLPMPLFVTACVIAGLTDGLLILSGPTWAVIPIVLTAIAAGELTRRIYDDRR